MSRWGEKHVQWVKSIMCSAEAPAYTHACCACWCDAGPGSAGSAIHTCLLCTGAALYTHACCAGVMQALDRLAALYVEPGVGHAETAGMHKAVKLFLDMHLKSSC